MAAELPLAMQSQEALDHHTLDWPVGEMLQHRFDSGGTTNVSDLLLVIANWDAPHDVTDLLSVIIDWGCGEG